jgi:predicted enzyme related to lactoylglutathione lyase
MGGKHLALAAAASIALGAGEPASAEPLKVERFGLYVAAEDVPATARFYERLFGAPPQRTTPVFVGFDLAGGLFAVVSKAAYGLQVGSGSRVRPYIRVADVDGAFRQANEVAPERLESRTVIEEGPFRFFRITDPEGNVVEIFALSGGPPS